MTSYHKSVKKNIINKGSTWECGWVCAGASISVGHNLLSFFIVIGS